MLYGIHSKNCETWQLSASSFSSTTSSTSTATLGRERIGLLEVVLEVADDRVDSEVGSERDDVRDGDHVGGVLHQDRGVAVVGMVVVRSRTEHQVGLELPDRP